MVSLLKSWWSLHTIILCIVKALVLLWKGASKLKKKSGQNVQKVKSIQKIKVILIMFFHRERISILLSFLREKPVLISLPESICITYILCIVKLWTINVDVIRSQCIKHPLIYGKLSAIVQINTNLIFLKGNIFTLIISKNL